MNDWSLGNADILQTIATLQWIHKGDSAMLEKIAGFRLG